jgi:hypothetical protein
MATDKETKQQEQGVALTAADLQKLLSTVIAEAKKPTALEQAKLDAEAEEKMKAQQHRLEQAESIKAEMAQKAMEKRLCSHKHSTGQSHGVYIQDGNYILCQKHQCKIRPGVAPTNYQGSDIYDTALFNEVFQSLSQTSDIN